MPPDARMRVLAFQPNFKLDEFGVHGSLLFEEESITQTRNTGLLLSTRL